MADLTTPLSPQGLALSMPDLNWPAAVNLAFGAASASSAAINARAVMLSSDQNCWISMGANPAAVVGAGSLYLPLGARQLLPIQPGQKIAAIQATAGGNLSIVPAMWPDAPYPPPAFDWDFTTGALPPGMTFTRSSTAWYFNSAGLLVSAAANVPRFDYDPITLQPRGLLNEIATNNGCLWGRDLTQANWGKTNITAALNQTGIDGVANSASSITATAANGTVLQPFALGAGNRTISGYVKRLVGSGPVSVSMDNGATWIPITVTSGWTRFSNITQGNANPTIGFQLATSGDSIAVDCMQFELAFTYTTSPIPTTSATVNRAADTGLLSPIPWFNPAQGTLLARFDCGLAPYGIAHGAIALDDGGANNRYFLRAQYFYDAPAWAGGVGVYSTSGPPTKQPGQGPVRDAIAYMFAANSIQGAAAGQLLIGSGTPSAMPTGINRLSITIPAWVSRISYWPTRLTDTVLQAATQ